MWQQFRTGQQTFVNSGTGNVTLSTSPVLGLGVYAVHVSIAASVFDSPAVLVCSLGTTGTSDIVNYDPGYLGVNEGAGFPKEMSSNVTFNGTINIKGSRDKVVVKCSDGDNNGAELTSWSVTEEPLASLTVG